MAEERYESGRFEGGKALMLAAEIGKEHGTAAGSWVVDGNTDDATIRDVIRWSEDGELFDHINPSSPLSGEWADGYSLDQLREDCGVEYDGSEDVTELVNTLADAYEDAYWQAYEAEAVRSARAMLPDDRPLPYRCPVCGEPCDVTRGPDARTSVFLHGDLDDGDTRPEDHGPVFDWLPDEEEGDDA